ncbi:unnamed protein product, partial [marine sediment metagenome]
MNTLNSIVKILVITIVMASCGESDDSSFLEPDDQNNDPAITEPIIPNPKKGLGITFKATNWKTKVE